MKKLQTAKFKMYGGVHYQFVSNRESFCAYADNAHLRADKTTIYFCKAYGHKIPVYSDGKELRCLIKYNKEAMEYIIPLLKNGVTVKDAVETYNAMVML